MQQSLGKLATLIACECPQPSKQTLGACKNLEKATDEQLGDIWRWGWKEKDEWGIFLDMLVIEFKKRGIEPWKGNP